MGARDSSRASGSVYPETAQIVFPQGCVECGYLQVRNMEHAGETAN